MGARARIGTSGWIYPEWRGAFYPDDLPERRWFGHYAEHFDTVEINNTFYRLPPASTVDRWAEQAPPGFTYAVKVGGFGTHRKKLRTRPPGCRTTSTGSRVSAPTSVPTWCNCPRTGGANVGRLDEFLAAAPSSMRWAVELRDPSWLHDDVYAVLSDHGAALVVHDLLPEHPWLLTTDWTYLRFHGPHAPDDPYRDRYTGRRLWRVAARIEHWLSEGIDVHAYFNNDQASAAPVDATWLRRKLDRR